MGSLRRSAFKRSIGGEVGVRETVADTGGWVKEKWFCTVE